MLIENLPVFNDFPATSIRSHAVGKLPVGPTGCFQVLIDLKLNSTNGSQRGGGNMHG